MTTILVLKAIRLAIAWLDGAGDGEELARTLLDLAVETGVPAEQLAAFLSTAAAKRADALADIAQLAKVGPRP